ncbi:MAG: sigma-70 family RNA polymerase sigma factor [Planctomycetes bacterium]|nr:sigma-70 family RNA polymerase sigma factor [Planctomycetota bacterium]
MDGSERPRDELEGLLERHIGEIESYVRRNMGAELARRESCEDLVQSVCREALQSRAQFRYGGEEAFRRWLLQIALHKLIDRRRFYTAQRRAGGVRAADLASEWDIEALAKLAKTLGSPSGEAMLREELARLAEALEQLSEADRSIIRMIHIEARTHADAADRMGCSEAQSRGRLFLALARLSTHLRGPAR